HGAVPAARAFLDAGAQALGVSSVAEAVELRRADLTGPLLVLGGAFPGEEETVGAHDLAVAVWGAEQTRALARAARAAGPPLGGPRRGGPDQDRRGDDGARARLGGRGQLRGPGTEPRHAPRGRCLLALRLRRRRRDGRCAGAARALRAGRRDAGGGGGSSTRS